MSLDARIAFDNQSKTAGSIIASHDQNGSDFLKDNMTTMKWRPANLTSSISYSGLFIDTDYIGLAGVNWESAGVTLVIKDSLGATLATFAGLADNQPAFAIITKSTQSVVLFEFTCTTTLLEVGEIYFGQSILLPNGVSVGYQPARWSNNDLVTAAITTNGETSGSTIRSKGSTEKFTLNFIDILFMETVFKTFVRAAKGVPIFFVWDALKGNQAIYGMWATDKPSFVSSQLSSINLTIVGDYGFLIDNGLTGSQGGNSGSFR